ncbi:hypothetical protein [Sediminibacillus massiliensis]|uniref:hypothetical protein n=1 Tax=Sediminibacillus massiliensis TaxID=1926277 RepID=UPI0009886000|nr:hypothetical protein [Sediminibacillus massiliensis]
MLGLLVSDIEKKEIEYLLKRELEELIIDIRDRHIDYRVKRVMKERHRILFRLFRRVANEEECLKYIL